MVVRILTTLIELYRRCISPSFPPSCRFEPSCSIYAKRALGKYGLWRGGLLASKRHFDVIPGIREASTRFPESSAPRR